jgi:hypothetical protein
VILPWVQSKNLAAMLLAKVARVLPWHWQEIYGYRPVLLETFAEQPRFQGTCYKADNWVYLGKPKAVVNWGQLRRSNRSAPLPF